MDITDTDPESVARRELAQETGFGSDRRQTVSTLCPNPANQTNRLRIVLALDALEGGQPRLDPGEQELTVTVLPLDTAMAAVSDGVLEWASRVASLLLAVRLLERLPS